MVPSVWDIRGIQFAPYNQVFQELLDETGLLSSNDGANLLLVRFEDWIRDDRSAPEEQIKKIDGNFEKISAILKKKPKRAPYFIGIFPVSNHLQLSDTVTDHLAELSNRWKEVLEGLGNVYTVDFRELDTLYGIEEIFDPVKDQEGHLPFSEMYYGAMGAALARKICAWQKPPFKVIVLDCDHTLWKGVCGEDGASGVKIEDPYRALQNFMLERYREGMLLLSAVKIMRTTSGKYLRKTPVWSCGRNTLSPGESTGIQNPPI